MCGNAPFGGLFVKWTRVKFLINTREVAVHTIHTAQIEMATYQQYSEVVAAYGHTVPPPEQLQVQRVGVALLYAAIGVALGTMTGTGVAVASMQPGGVTGWAHRLSIPNFSGAMKNAHNPSAPVVAHTAPAPTPAAAQVLQAKAAAPVATAPIQIQAQVQTPAGAKTATAAPAHVQARIAAPAPVVANAIAPPAASVPVAHPGIIARVLSRSVVEASVDVRALQSPVAPHSAAVNPRLATAPAVSSQDATLHTVPAQKPAMKLARLHTPAALPIPSVVPVNLDEQVVPAMFFSEGDATVVDYDGSLDTILTSDGKTFVVGPTVAMSSAASWDDFRDNVHYRCDQGGKCTLSRNGVIALSAKQI
jgi:hypothetical protein